MVNELLFVTNSVPIFVWILKPVPVVIFVSPGLKHKFAKKDAWASPATPVIGIFFEKLSSKLLTPKSLALGFTSAKAIFLILINEEAYHERYKMMASVPIEGSDAMFSIQADIIDKNGYQVPVFEVKVKKDIILYDQNKDLLDQENKVISVDGVNGSEIILGSMTEVSINGNWPSTFDAKNDQ